MGSLSSHGVACWCICLSERLLLAVVLWGEMGCGARWLCLLLARVHVWLAPRRLGKSVRCGHSAGVRAADGTAHVMRCADML